MVEFGELVLLGAVFYIAWLYKPKPTPPPPSVCLDSNDCRKTDPNCDVFNGGFEEWACLPKPEILGDSCHACQIYFPAPNGKACEPFDCRTKGCPASRRYCLLADKSTNNPSQCHACCTDQNMTDCEF